MVTWECQQCSLSVLKTSWNFEVFTENPTQYVRKDCKFRWMKLQNINKKSVHNIYVLRTGSLLNLGHLLCTLLAFLTATDHVACSHIDLTDAPVNKSQRHCCTHNCKFLSASSTDKTGNSVPPAATVCPLTAYCCCQLPNCLSWIAVATIYCNPSGFICASLLQALTVSLQCGVRGCSFEHIQYSSKA